MTIRADITYEAGWRFGEEKVLTIRVLDDEGAPVDCSLIGLMDWFLLRNPNDERSRAYLVKNKTAGIDLGEETNLVNISIDLADYLVPGIPAAGYYWHELWDMSSHAKLSEGLVVVASGTL